MGLESDEMLLMKMDEKGSELIFKNPSMPKEGEETDYRNYERVIWKRIFTLGLRMSRTLNFSIITSRFEAREGGTPSETI